MSKKHLLFLLHFTSPFNPGMAKPLPIPTNSAIICFRKDLLPILSCELRIMLPSPSSVYMRQSGRRGQPVAQAQRQSRGKAAQGAAEFTDLYELDFDKKCQCLHSMDRVQWNQHITGGLSNEDATDTLIN